MKVKHWTCCVLTAALLSVGGMAQAEKLVLPDGLSLDLGANTYVVSGKNTYMGKKLGYVLDGKKPYDRFYEDYKKAVGEVQNEKGPAILLPDDAKNKKYLQLTGELFKNFSVHQVNLKEEGSWYQAILVEGTVTKEQLESMTAYSKELAQYNISKLEKEKADPKLIQFYKDQLAEIDKKDGKKKKYSAQELEQVIRTSLQQIKEGSFWDFKIYSIDEKNGTVGKEKNEYSIGDVRLALIHDGFYMPLYEKAITVESKDTIHFALFIMDHPSGKKISKIVDKAMKGATYEK